MNAFVNCGVGTSSELLGDLIGFDETLGSLRNESGWSDLEITFVGDNWSFGA